MNILISACLLGIGCRYDGKAKEYKETDKLLNICTPIPFCPECYGGLSTPRPPSEIVMDKVITASGNDVTTQFFNGANAALLLCKKLDIKYALLKEKSPSCGSGRIYDGTFSHTLTDGDGITSKILKYNGITVFGESQIEELLALLYSKGDE